MRPVAKHFLRIFFSFLLMGAVLFGISGSLAWPGAWALMALYTGGVALTGIVLVRVSPDLVAERAQPGPGVPPWDRYLSWAVGLYGPLATWTVAALDRRLRWSPPLAPWIPAAALALAAAGVAVAFRAMLANRFFSRQVRIQRDRRHAVVSTGPYRRVRHPGYAGAALSTLATPLVLGSLQAEIPAALTLAALVVRIALEDRLLQRELDGYREYATRVRRRLIPGVW